MSQKKVDAYKAEKTPREMLSVNTLQSMFEKGFLQDVRHNLWEISPG